MGQISAGSGLVSGLPTDQIISRLLQREQQPKQQAQQHTSELEAQKKAYQDINSKLMALKTSVEGFTEAEAFGATSASTSNKSVLGATSGKGAVPGNYTFRVNQLVGSQQTITRGFQDMSATPVGAGTLSFEPLEARLDSDTRLSQLNGGEGVERGKIQISDRAGSSAIVDLTTVVDVDDVLKTINQNTGVNVRARVEGDAITLTDQTGATGSDLTVTNVGDTKTASSLGLAGAGSGDTLTGAQINRLGQQSNLSRLNDGNGVRTASGQADVKLRLGDGSNAQVDLSGAVTLGDVSDRIDAATDGKVQAAVADSGVGLKLTDTTGGGGTFSVSAVNGSKAGEDLGILGSDGDGAITGERVVAAINSKLLSNLNGGSGVAAGSIAITNAAGASTNVDLSGAQSVSEVMGAINDANVGVTASLNEGGNGLRLEDTTDGTGELTIAESGSTTAADLGLEGSYAEGVANSGSLETTYITENTRLDALGVKRGTFTIRDSSGGSATVDLTQGNEQTIGDVLSEINSRGLDVNARVNDSGDGILLEDTGSGASAITVEDEGSTTAADLGLAGAADSAGANINGTFERQVTIGENDTLRDVAEKINEASAGVNAAIINDGSRAAPYRLSLSSEKPGKTGGFVFDDGGLDFGATNLAEARNAEVFFGSTDPARAMVITSDSNALEEAIPGATIDLKSTSDEPVQVSISQDDASVADKAQKMVEGFNKLIDALDKYDKYNKETDEKGVLLGDGTVGQVRRSVYNAVINPNNEVPGQFKTLSQVGITVEDGAKLSLDRDKFMEAMRTDREAVEELFSFKQTEEQDGEQVTTAQSVGVELQSTIERLTDSVSGTIQRQVDSIDDRIELNKDRVESIDQSIQAKRKQLQQEFAAMERAISRMQSQQSALSRLSSLAGNDGAGGGGGSGFAQFL